MDIVAHAVWMPKWSIILQKPSVPKCRKKAEPDQMCQLQVLPERIPAL